MRQEKSALQSLLYAEKSQARTLKRILKVREPSKVDGFVPRIQLVNLRIVQKPRIFSGGSNVKRLEVNEEEKRIQEEEELSTFE